MAKTITFEYDGTEYTLEYTRKSIETMESKGFKASDIADKPMLTLPKLFAGAFLSHHKFTKQETINEIYDLMPNKEELISKLAEMYSEPIEALLGEPANGDGKNIKWGASW